MNPKKMGLFAFALGLALAGCHGQDTSSNSSQNLRQGQPNIPVTSAIPTGLWGGADVQLQVQNDGSALITFDCGSGGTSVPIVPDPTNANAFTTAGTYQSFNNPGVQPILDVTYTGNLNGDGSITFSITFNPNDTVPAGAPGTVSAVPGTMAQLQTCQAF
jgi:hypothetical protein